MSARSGGESAASPPRLASSTETAVFSPLYEKSKPGRFDIGRGKFTAVGSPFSASFEIAGPPG